MYFDDYFSEEIISRAVSLTRIGVHKLAWSKKDTLEVLKEADSQDMLVVGGDVLEVCDGNIRYTYDNWYVRREEAESLHEYRVRAYRKAVEYIEWFPESSDCLTIYAPVFDPTPIPKHYDELE